MDYLVPVVKKRGFCSQYSNKNEGQQQEEIRFEIIEIADNVRLAIAPLNERNDKYLCIYLESSALDINAQKDWLTIIYLPKKAPYLNPNERRVNQQIKSDVCANRFYQYIPGLRRFSLI